MEAFSAALYGLGMEQSAQSHSHISKVKICINSVRSPHINGAPTLAVARFRPPPIRFERSARIPPGPRTEKSEEDSAMYGCKKFHMVVPRLV